MKSKMLLAAALFATSLSSAQTTKSILFDVYNSPSNNDLKNQFIGEYSFNQQSTGGISGGAIKIDGNYDVDVYKIKDFAGFRDTLDINASDIKASICFKYIANTAPQYETALLKIATVGVPDWTMSNFITAYFEKDGGPGSFNTLGVKTISHMATNSIHDDLIVGNWYKLSLDTKRNTYAGASDTIQFTVSLHNLGTSGTAAAQLISTKTGDIRLMTDFYNPEYDVVVGISGNLGGGAEYLDNFSVTGTFKGQQTSVANVVLDDNIFMANIVYNNLEITCNKNDMNLIYKIYSMEGKTLKTGSLNSNTNIDVADLASGSYFISFLNKQSKLTKRFTKR